MFHPSRISYCVRRGLKSPVSRRLAYVLSILVFCGSAWATDVTLRLVDQGAGLIPSSTFIVNATTVLQEGTITLAPGSYSVQVQPGRKGQPGDSLLYRTETISVSGTSQLVEFTWPTAGLTAEILDQFGDPIPASAWDPTFVAGGAPATGTVFDLPVTVDPGKTLLGDLATDGYSMVLYPGLGGSLGGPLLYREENAGALPASGLTHTITWPTAPLSAEILDQFGDPIPASRWDPTHVGGGQPATGTAITVPVTVDPGVTLLGTLVTDGYDVVLYPGRAGNPGDNLLYRKENVGSLDVSGLTHTITWPTASLTTEVLDQFGDPIPASRWDPISVAGGQPAAGTALTVPVTVDPGQTLLGDMAVNGYSVDVYPGRNGSLGGPNLSREAGSGPVGVSGVTVSVTWEVSTGALSVVDASEVEVAGSSMKVAGQAEIATGTTVSFPVNDDVVYPTLAGAYAGGYPVEIRLAAGDPLEGPFDFEFQPAKVINPAFVQIAATDYGLRFDVQPVVDLDGDGFPVPDDCDDSDPAINPSAAELPGNVVDENCDGALDCDPCATWRNHGHYVSCVANAVDDLVAAGNLTTEEGDDLVNTAARSDVGKKDFVPDECQ